MSSTGTHTVAKTGNLAVTLATWLYLLDDAGHRPAHEGLVDALDALKEAGGGEAADAVGRKLVEVVLGELGDEASFEQVHAWMSALYSPDAIADGFGGSREDRTRRVRAYEFLSSLPWVAMIIERFPSGHVGRHWVLVERVTDVVTCMDPYPWDDLDEEYSQPLVEFMVKWELAGCHSLRWHV
jgi:hypothetical protein